MIDEDHRRFCLRCGWNDEDYGCISPPGESVWQCEMYRHYHPEEVKQFEKEMDEIEYVEEDEELIIDRAQFEKFNKSIRKEKR